MRKKQFNRQKEQPLKWLKNQRNKNGILMQTDRPVKRKYFPGEVTRNV